MSIASASGGLLVVFALALESAGQFDRHAPLYSGVGKVNAAYSLTKRLSALKAASGHPPRMVLNLGSAGSAQFKAGTVVNCTSFVQRDIDATVLGFEPFSTPYDSGPVTLKTGTRFDGHPEATCGTGDSFATDRKMIAWNVVDMEAYALAKVCAAEQVPFGCLKYISDGADGLAASTWKGALLDGATRLRVALDNITASLEKN